MDNAGAGGRYDEVAQHGTPSDARHRDFKRPAVRGKDPEVEEFVGAMAARMQEAGIFPLKIRLPKAGTVHRFNRLMTAQEALELDALFVNLPTMMFPIAGLGLLLLSSGGAFLWRVWRP
jgi:hypothetical protein